jgi:tRNA nucleotidyltransferase (CCA-adding enzyme)
MYQRHGKLFSNSEAPERLRAQLLAHDAIHKLVRVFADIELYAVGGIVRDLLLDRPIDDIDLATSLRPEAVLDRLTNAQIRVVETGIEHGTVLAVIDGVHIEITTFRNASPRAATTFSQTIEEDLHGRDFTFNALALSLKQGPLLDPFNGVNDLANSTIRAVGNPAERLSEDPLRLLRFIRFGVAQGRTADEQTQEAVRKHAALLNGVHKERIQKELVRIITGVHASASIRELLELELLPTVLPELVPAVGFEQNVHHIHDVFEHTLWVLDRTPPEDLVLRLTALLHDSGKPHTLSIDEKGDRHFYLHEKVSEELTLQALSRLRFPRKIIETTALLVRHHMRPFQCGPSGVRRIMRDLGEELPRWRRFKEADMPPLMTAEEFSALAISFDRQVELEVSRSESIHHLAMDGFAVLELGVTKGPQVGEVLRYLRELTIDTPELNRQDVLREYAARYIKERGLLAGKEAGGN